MRSVIRAVVACLLCVLAATDAAAAWSWGRKPLMVIDGQEYSADEYKAWWQQWRDRDDQKQESIEPFVNWMLMVREAERMDLATLPDFKHKVEVFVEARALMLLKQEEVDSKIAINDADLQASYDRQYVPRRLIGALEFASLDQATRFKDRFAGQAMTLEGLRVLPDGQAELPFVLQQPQWLRPINTPVSWQAALEQAAAGALCGPVPLGEKAAILFVAEVKVGDQDDFAKKKAAIHYDLRKRREQALTEELVRVLMSKYQVRLAEEVLQKISLTDPGRNDREQVLITSDRSSVTVGYFLDQIRKEIDITHALPTEADGQMQMKRRLAKTMIANSVVSWEALARHYEEKEALAGAYRFYRQNRLVVELENRTPGAGQPVAEVEAQAYYQAHQDDFRRPDMIRGVMVAGPEAAVKTVWAEVAGGGELSRAAEANAVKVAVPAANEVPLQHFSAAAQKVLAGLKAGEMSPPFLDNDQWVVIRLIEQRAGTAIPYEQVAQTVKERVAADNKARRRQVLTEALRARSTVTINDDVWAAIVEEK